MVQSRLIGFPMKPGADEYDRIAKVVRKGFAKNGGVEIEFAETATPKMTFRWEGFEIRISRLSGKKAKKDIGAIAKEYASHRPDCEKIASLGSYLRIDCTDDPDLDFDFEYSVFCFSLGKIPGLLLFDYSDLTFHDEDCSTLR